MQSRFKFSNAGLLWFSQVMYINMYGCDRYGYLDTPARANRCTSPNAYPGIGPCFFMVYILIATFVMLNLFIGVVCIAMEESHDEITAELELGDKIDRVTAKHQLSGTQFRTIETAYNLINTDGDLGIEAGELSEALTVAGIDVSVEAVETTLRDIGGEDLSIDLSEFIEFLQRQSVKMNQVKMKNLAGAIGRTAVTKKMTKTMKEAAQKEFRQDELAAAALAKITFHSTVITAAQSAAAALQALFDSQEELDAPTKAKSEEFHTAVVRFLSNDEVKPQVRNSDGTKYHELPTDMPLLGQSDLEAINKQGASDAAHVAGSATAAAAKVPNTTAAQANLATAVFASSTDDATQYKVLVGELQDAAAISVGKDGIKLFTDSGINSCHWAWQQVSFWVTRRRNTPDADELVVLGIQPSPLSPTGYCTSEFAAPGEITGSHTVLKLECGAVGSLCADLTRYRPCATPPPPIGPDHETANATRLTQNRAALVDGPSCRLFPIQSEKGAAYPEEAALRVCHSGLQVTTHVDHCGAYTQPPAVLQSWFWSDVAFWKFTRQGDGLDTLDVLVIGLQGAGAVGLSGGQDGGMALFRAETEDTDAAHAMLEVHCPENPQLTVYATDHHSQLGHGLTAFEVFKVPLPSGEPHDEREARARLHIGPDTGITLYGHEDSIPAGCSDKPTILQHWAWKSIGDCTNEKGVQVMDLVRISVLGASDVVFESEDGDPIVARLNEWQSSLGSFGSRDVSLSNPQHMPQQQPAIPVRATPTPGSHSSNETPRCGGPADCSPTEGVVVALQSESRSGSLQSQTRIMI